MILQEHAIRAPQIHNIALDARAYLVIIIGDFCLRHAVFPNINHHVEPI